MGESVIVRQDSEFGLEVLARDPHDHHSDEYQPVDDIRLLTPYGMLLVSLASCTAVVLLTYAKHHDVGLEQVELRLTYDRVYGEDCKTCEEEYDFEERIDEEIVLLGELSPNERKRLFSVSKQCPIHKIASHGIEISSRLQDTPPHDAEETA